ncbi:MAG: hypothetical protein LGR52_04770 [Candidatus Thiosymbion ectosymbiont of Robbea hypermnestra]|nr:hypothetical protein [Candidatus Thiosymbion ectosymbiont of Robbea hypermnestra]
MNKLTKQARIITGEVILDGFRGLAQDDILSRIDFGELACQIFDNSAFNILREKLSPGELFFSPEIDHSIAQVSEAIDGIEDTEDALYSREGFKRFKIAQEFARRCIPLLERWLALNNFSRSHALRGNAEAPRRGVSRRCYES